MEKDEILELMNYLEFIYLYFCEILKIGIYEKLYRHNNKIIFFRFIMVFLVFLDWWDIERILHLNLV